MLANEFLLPSVVGFRVDMCEDFPTHKPLQLKIVTHCLEMSRRKLRKPESAAEAVASKIDDVTKELQGQERTQARAKEMDNVHSLMDEEVQSRAFRMQAAADERDSNRL